jgi:hypothetical protein
LNRHVGVLKGLNRVWTAPIAPVTCPANSPHAFLCRQAQTLVW